MLFTGSRRSCAGGIGGTGGFALFPGIVEVRRVLKALEIVLYMLEVVDCVRPVLWVPRFMLCMLLCILEAVGGELRLLEVCCMPKAMESVCCVGSCALCAGDPRRTCGMCCVLLCTLGTVYGDL